MGRRLLFLNGLAILTIPIHHATAYGLQAMFIWTDRFRDVSVPNYDLLGSLAYYVMVIIRQLDTYSVPAFLFISGYFVAFMVRGKNSTLSPGTVIPRIKVLVPPFIVWTVIRYALLRHVPTSLDEVLDPYHFVPILIQFYLLSPWLVPLARRNWKAFLSVFALIHLGVQSIRYVANLGVGFPGLDLLLTLTPRWIFIGQQPFWFPFGLVFGLHSSVFTPWLRRYRWQLVAATIFFGVSSFVEYQIADYLNGELWIGPTFSGFSRNFYILFFILAALTIDIKAPRLTKIVNTIGAHSLGIYLANIPVVYVIAVAMYRLTPQILGIQPVYVTVLFTAGLGIPLLLMWLVRRSPFRPAYRLLFG